MSTQARIRAFMAATLAGIAILTGWGLSLHAGRPAHSSAQPAAQPTAPSAPTPAFDDESGESD